MSKTDIIAAEYSSWPTEDAAGMFPGRPWVVYYERATRRDGKRARRGFRSFETEANAHAWRDELGHFGDDGFRPL